MKQRNRSLRLIAGVATLLMSGLLVGFTSVIAREPAGGAMKSPPLVLGPMIFVSNRDRILNRDTGTPNGNEIYTMDANGSNVQRLTTNATAEWEPHWNPAGTKIAFTSNLAVNGNPWDGNWDVYTMDPNDPLAPPVNLTNSPSYDFGSTWSPDGLQIVFASDRDGDSDIYVMNSGAPDPNPVKLTHNGVSDGHPAWSLDGDKIAFTSSNEIWTMDANGDNPVPLTNNAAVDSLPAWSPDRSKIAFTSYRTGGGDIYSMNADGSGLKRLTNNSAEELEPAWSPDGTKIVYYRRHDGSNSNNTEIYTMNADGKHQVRLTNNYPFVDGDPTWKP